MNKSRILRTLVVLALVAAAVALYQVDLLGLLRRLHGQG